MTTRSFSTPCSYNYTEGNPHIHGCSNGECDFLHPRECPNLYEGGVCRSKVCFYRHLTETHGPYARPCGKKAIDDNLGVASVTAATKTPGKKPCNFGKGCRNINSGCTYQHHCIFATQRSGCKNGDECKFLH